jgi:conjugal transfer pilus assembly protein TraV
MSALTRPSLALCATALLAACTNMSGLSGSSSYACMAPEGVTCESVSGTYANAIHDNLPGQRPRAEVAAATEPAASAAAAVRVPMPGAAAPAPSPTSLRSSPRILRLWFKPWEDADHDLYDQGFVFVQIDSGRWLIEHAQARIREAYAPRSTSLRPPPRATEVESGDDAMSPPSPGSAGSPPRLPSPDRLLPGLVPPSARPDTGD